MKKVLFLLLAGITLNVSAQKGYLRGKVIDGESGEGLFGATVTQQGTTNGSVADFDGNYSVSLEPGIHTFVVQFISYETKTIEGVEIKAGEVTTLDVTISEDVQQLEAVVVVAEQVKDNEVAMMSVQRKSSNTVDGISSAAFKKVGDNNLSSAMKRVTGVTVQGGKYVYVRGLGDRYTKTALNGMVVPGLDPDRNDVQIDIFPTSILENVVVYKTFSPNLTGDFSGGLVNIQTKAFPDVKTTSVSVGFGFNPDMHFKSGYLTDDSSEGKLFGFGNKNYELPVAKGETFSGATEQELADATRSFSSKLGALSGTSFMNSNFSFVHRNQVNAGRVTWGYNAILSYQNNIQHYDDFLRKGYERDKTGSEVVMARDYTARGVMSVNDVLWSGLVSLAAKVDNHTIGTNFLHTQNGTSTAVSRFMNRSSLNNPIDIYNDILTYTQRSMTNNITFGKHQFNKLRVEWTNSFLYSEMSDPDYRDTRITEDDNGRLGFQNGGSLDRFWRELSEVSESFKLDFTYDLNDKNEIKFGGLTTFRNRDFNVYAYSYDNQEINALETTDPNEILIESRMYSSENTSGLVIRNNSNDYNNYEGQQEIFAGYVMNEMKITDKFKSIYGVRLEKVNMYYTGVKTNTDTPDEYWDKVQTMNKSNFLPSLSLIYALRDDMNVRASYNQTVARPSFKEKSNAFIEDPITNIRFTGNLDLRQAQIDNYDVRWEYFFKPGQMVSVSAFYKGFTDHIALVFYENATNQVKPRNVGEAKVMGTEFEFRKSLDFLGSSFLPLSFGTNISLVYSEVNRESVTVNESGLSEYDAEVSYLGTSEGVDKTRQMTGQSPYVINAYLSYDNSELGLTGNLSYNVQGETIALVGVTEAPHVYDKPFNSLNLKISKNLNDKSSFSVSAKNLLNDDRLRVFKYDDQEQIFSRLKPGRTFSVKYSYTF